MSKTIRLTKLDTDRWVHGGYLVRRTEWDSYVRYIVTGPGISLKGSYGGGNDIRTLAEAREVIQYAISSTEGT